MRGSVNASAVKKHLHDTSKRPRFNRATHGVDHAAELDKNAIPGALDDAAVVHGDGRIDQVAAQRPEPLQRAIFVRAGEPAVADHVRDQDRSKFSRLAHGAPSRANAFEARGDIDAVAHQIAVALFDDVAEMDADAKLDPPLGLDARIAFDHAVLQVDNLAISLSEGTRIVFGSALSEGLFLPSNLYQFGIVRSSTPSTQSLTGDLSKVLSVAW